MRALVSTLSWLLAACILLAATPADAARKKGKKAEPDAAKGTLPNGLARQHPALIYDFLLHASEATGHIEALTQFSLK